MARLFSVMRQLRVEKISLINTAIHRGELKRVIPQTVETVCSGKPLKRLKRHEARRSPS